jgi:pimeloyl-ACP methyl ester carboxylesterase
VMGRFFSDAVRAAGRASVGTTRTTLLATDPVGYAGCCAAVRDLNQVSLLPQIAVPTLVIGGDADQSTPWAGHGEVLVSSIPGASAVKLETAHLSNLEEPERFTRVVVEFLGS